MKQAWLVLPERSNLFWLHTINWIALRIGQWLSRPLLYPISTYFVIFSCRARKAASRDFLRRVLKRDCNWVDVFRHYHTFACTLLDRIYIFGGQSQLLDIRIQGLTVLESYARSGRGCLLVGAHLGGFEILRVLGQLNSGYRIKALVYGEATPRISGMFRKMNPSFFEDIIYMGSGGSLIGLDEHARKGGIIALMGDRSVQTGKRIRCEFFGQPAWFPQAPVLLSQILDMPLVLFCCLHRGDGRYEVWFEHLSDPPRIERRERETAVHCIMQRYAHRLEHYCRMAPYNWFNFYNFWQLDE